MALLHMNGFDNYANAAELGSEYNKSFSNDLEYESTRGRFGGGAIFMTRNEFIPVPVDVPDGGTVIFGASYLIQETSPDNGTTLVSFTTAGGNRLFGIESTATGGEFRVVDGANTVLATFTVTMDVWNWLEAKAVLSATGSFEVRYSGVTVASGTGNFSNGNAVTEVRIRGVRDSTIAAPSSSDGWDDLVVMDGTGTTANDFIGDSRIHTVLPAADGTSTQWTALGAGTHFSEVDEGVPDGDTSYVESATIGNRDLFDMSALGVSTTEVNGVSLRVRGRISDASNLNLRILVKKGAGEVTQDHILGSNYASFRQTVALNPETNGAWTVADFDATEFGVEVI